ncbi:CD225/dispanin family protein [Kribbella pittospori]|uniref:CD225/dispanin family protein n=1 Tax=Kribbella pittospori TaxID=722689 RepID=A0A4R0KYC7_9ACTN|nr:CD225/dispanin family protein [Kribbella pittospori]TCC65680.1 CD225/dispanin family protein [Kribbella pittospori]
MSNVVERRSVVVKLGTVVVSPSRTRSPEPSPVRSHLAAAVVCTLVCFAPLGVAAVVCAGNVRTRLALGDIEGARRASRTAKWLCWTSVAVTVGFLLVIVVGAGSYSDVH